MKWFLLESSGFLDPKASGKSVVGAEFKREKDPFLRSLVDAQTVAEGRRV
jgi:hypothetical protein